MVQNTITRETKVLDARRLALFSAILILLGLGAGCARLGGSQGSSENFAPAGIGDKLGRGLANVGLSWLEVPRGIETKVRKNAPNPSVFDTTFGIAFGSLHGVVNTAERALGGVYETVMSPFPPYEPLMSPAYPPYLNREDPPIEKKQARPEMKKQVEEEGCK